MESIITTIIEVIELTPQQGFYLTQTTLDEREERSFSEKVFLAKDATESNWRLATLEERDSYKNNIN